MCSGYHVVICLFYVYLFLSPRRGEMEPFVINGQYTKIAKYPHSMFLNIRCPPGSWICGSSILNQRILLTAAHCLAACKKQWGIDGFAGHEDLSKVNVMRSVIRFVKHEKYNDTSLINDIALMSLDSNLPLGRYIQRVVIRRSHSPTAFCNVAGWGMINRVTGEYAVILKTARQRLMTARSCARFGYLVDSMMCARSPKKNTSPAVGDSGSALVTKDFQQIGLVSYIFTEHPNTPIYTNVSYYYNWIKRKARMLHCKDRAVILRNNTINNKQAGLGRTREITIIERCPAKSLKRTKLHVLTFTRYFTSINIIPCNIF